MYFEELRKQYENEPFNESELAAEPSVQLQKWIDEAVATKQEVANAMAIATVDAQGRPSCRMVLLKDLTREGLTFFTNYGSQKGQELAKNGAASLLFYWCALNRQVRVEGNVTRLAPAESDAYFDTRPRDSNLSAMASPQSQVVASRATLEQRVAALRQTWEGRELERPADWGGFRLVPQSFEFFQGRSDRLHDRLRYRSHAGGWVIERLAP